MTAVIEGQSPAVEPSKPRLLGLLGPGLIAGASDSFDQAGLRPTPRQARSLAIP